MKTRHKKLNLFEDNGNSFLYSNKKENYNDSDEDYNVNENDFSCYNDDEEEDPSYFANKAQKKYCKNTTTKKTSIKKIKPNKIAKKKIMRKSFKNSLGKKKINNIQDNIENINNNNIKEFFKNYVKINQKSPKMKTSKKKEIVKNIKEKEKQIVESQLDKDYFYQDLTSSEWNNIANFISSSLLNTNLNEEDIEYFFSQYPNLSKGENNIKKLRYILENSTKNNGGFFNFYSKKTFEFDSYQKLNDFIIRKFYMVKPSIFEVHFFPNSVEEIHLINLLSKTRISADIAMFTINNVRIADEIKNLFNKGIKLRIITDCEMLKKPSSNIYSLAAMGISIKTDDSVRYYMHHKFCVIDNSVVITGSFNWTDQAVNHNQENLFFLENKNLAMKYSNEFQRLWDDFEMVITKEKGLAKIQEIEEKKRVVENRKKREKENKEREKNLSEIEDYSTQMNNYNNQMKNYNNYNNYNSQMENYNNQTFTNKKRYRSINDEIHDERSQDIRTNNQSKKGSYCFIF